MKKVIENSLVEKYQQTKDKAALTQLIQNHSKYLHKLANLYQTSESAPDDLYQEGVLKFIETLRFFDTTKNLRVSTYFYPILQRHVALYATKSRTAVYISSANSYPHVAKLLSYSMNNSIETHKQLKAVANKYKLNFDVIQNIYNAQCIAYNESTLQSYNSTKSNHIENIVYLSEINAKLDCVHKNLLERKLQSTNGLPRNYRIQRHLKAQGV